MAAPKSIVFDHQIDIEPLKSKNVVILGYGNQGRPQALNLRDSGINVRVGLREGSAKKELITSDQLAWMPMVESVQWADVILMLLPDDAMASVFDEAIKPNLKKGHYLGFGHGLVIHAGWITPPNDVNIFLLAPKGQGKGVRNKYLAGSGVPGLYGVHQDPSGDSKEVAMAYGKAIGCARVGLMPTTFKEETECDLFSEQAVLCGGLTCLIKNAFDTLVENGFSEEVAYFECLYEVKLIADLLHEKGITGMRQAISSTALYGDVTRGPRVVDSHVKETMQQVLDEVVSGRFASQMKAEFENQKPEISQAVEQDYHHPIEVTHRRLKELLKTTSV